MEQGRNPAAPTCTSERRYANAWHRKRDYDHPQPRLAAPMRTVTLKRSRHASSSIAAWRDVRRKGFRPSIGGCAMPVRLPPVDDRQ
jgi:hypothetical protein